MFVLETRMVYMHREDFLHEIFAHDSTDFEDEVELRYEEGLEHDAGRKIR